MRIRAGGQRRKQKTISEGRPLLKGKYKGDELFSYMHAARLRVDLEEPCVMLSSRGLVDPAVRLWQHAKIGFGEPHAIRGPDALRRPLAAQQWCKRLPGCGQWIAAHAEQVQYSRGDVLHRRAARQVAPAGLEARTRSEGPKSEQYLVLHRGQHTLAMTEIRHPKRSAQTFYPRALVDDHVAGQLQRFAMIRQHHHDRVLERSLALQHRDQFAEHRVRDLDSDAIGRPVVRVLFFRVAGGVSETKYGQ